MNHPSTEEWMAYLYGELPRTQASSLREHLHACDSCQDQFNVWQRARKDLSKWRLSRAPLTPDFQRTLPGLKWALAALVVVGLGFALGRLSAPKVDLGALRAAVEPALKASLLTDATERAQEALRGDWEAVLSGRTEMLDTPFRQQLKAGLNQWLAKTAAASTAANQQLLAEFASTYRANRNEDQQVVLTLFDRAEQARRAEHASLRRALETVAVVADDRFQRTDSQLGQLATYAQAKFVAAPSDPSFETQNQLTPKNN